MAKQYHKLGPNDVNALFDRDNTHTNAAAVVEGKNYLQEPRTK
jgi:hypothetical protein